MQDHVHWLVELLSGSLDKAVKRIKSVFTQDVGVAVWGDHGIRSDESLIHVARYIVANPVSAGLIERVGDYPPPHWDSIWLE
jgi:putative transposase